MKRLSDNQLIHRQYLQSAVWKLKRNEALAHYGCVCSRCKNHGSDVHHKTYDRVGGAELLSDLEVMCRGCHDAHHAAERTGRRRSGVAKNINRQSLIRFLTANQKRILKDKYSLNDGLLYLALVARGTSEVILEAEKMLGIASTGGALAFIYKPRRKSQHISDDQYSALLDAEKRKLQKLGVTTAWLEKRSLIELRKINKKVDARFPLSGIVGKRHLKDVSQLPEDLQDQSILSNNTSQPSSPLDTSSVFTECDGIHLRESSNGTSEAIDKSRVCPVVVAIPLVRNSEDN